MERKDYYKILGIDKKASQDEIKAAYRKLSLKFHPDRFASKSEKEQKEAEEKFKEVNEAYQTLGDEQKRKEYDNPNPFGNGGGNPFGGFGGFDFSDIFNSFGGNPFGRGRQQKRTVRGGDIRITLTVTLDEILKKTTKKVKYTRNEGNGTTCSHCGGTGMIYQQRGNTQFMSDCPYCGGTGIEMQKAQHECEFEINGICDKHDVQFNPADNSVSFVQLIEHEGNSVSTNRNENGNLIAIIRFVLPKGFSLASASDVAYDVEIPILDILLGGEIEVPTIDGKTLKTKIAQGLENGTQMRFSGKGLPCNGRNGNMIGIVKYKVPKTINSEEKEILSKLRGKTNFK